MEIQQLRYYLRLCEDRSFVAAAENLYISQQALRKSIKKAEEELGVELFYRKGNGINLTPAGECVRSFASIIVNELEVMEATVRTYREDAEYIEVVVAMANGCYDRLAVQAIEPFKRENPNVGVRIIEQPDVVCENYVARGAADFGICFGPNDPALFDVSALAREPVYALVNINNRLAGRKCITIGDLAGERIGLPDEHHKLFHNFVYACHKAGFKPDIGFRGNDPYSAHHYSHYTENLSITSGEHARLFAEDNQVAIPIRADDLTSTLNIIMRKGVSASPAALRLIERCRREWPASI